MCCGLSDQGNTKPECSFWAVGCVDPEVPVDEGVTILTKFRCLKTAQPCLEWVDIKQRKFDICM